MKLIPSTRLGLAAASAAGLAAAAGLSGGGYALAATNAPAASIPAANNQLYACVTYNPATKVSRTISDAYTSKSNFLAWLAKQPGQKCPDSGFAVGLAGGQQGAPGANGLDGLAGAFYSVENYPSGGDGWATVACDPNDATNSQKYVAVSGGVEEDDAPGNAGPQGSSVIASFPGRMDWSTNSPEASRLDGWVIGLSGGNNTPLKVWALCVPAANAGPNGIPIHTNNDS